MIYEFHDLTLDLDRHLLTRGGQPVKLTELCFKVLEALVRAAPALISHEDLIDQVWGSNRVISPDNLSQRMTTLRKSLGDDADNPVYVESVRGAGYRLIPEVNNQAAGKPGQSFSRAWPSGWALPLIVILAGILSWFVFDRINPTADEPAAVSMTTPEVEAPASDRPQQPAIAVLPFANMSADPSNQYFADGIHDDLTTRISNIRHIKTISRTSVMTYRGSNKKLKTIARELGVNAILEGGVQRAGDQVRINLQLIDAESDVHLWAKAYTRELSASNVFAIQAEISESVAGALKTILTDDERRRLEKPPTVNTEALEAFFRGRVSFGLANSEGFSAAIEHFQRAVRLDPEFAEAHAQLGLALLRRIHFGGLPKQDQVALAEPAIKRALKLKPELSEAYEALGLLEQYRNNRSVAAIEAAYETAIKLNSNNASALRAFGSFKCLELKQSEQALPLVNRARFLDPHNHYTLGLLGQVLMQLERFEETKEVLNAAIDSNPNFAPSYVALGHLHYSKLYQFDKAIKAYRRAYFLDPGVQYNTQDLGYAYSSIGLPDKAIHFFERYLKSKPEGVFSYFARLELHKLRGESEQEKLVFEEMKKTLTGSQRWIDTWLGSIDVSYGHPELAVERFEAIYPKLMLADLEIEADPVLFKLATAYVTVLHLSGEGEKAAPLTTKILKILPSKSRHRWQGIGVMDAWLHMAMGNNVKAMQALREWRELGGCLDLTQHHVSYESNALVPNSLFGSPEFQALNNEIRAELAEQRANLARMEAAGELAPIPDVPAI